MRKFWLVLAVAVALPASASAEGDDSDKVTPNQPVKRQFDTNFSEVHDKGAFVRLSVGAGYAKRGTSPGAGEASTTLAGAAGFPAIDVGGLVAPGAALHASGWGLLGTGVQSLAAGFGGTTYFNPRKGWWLSAKVGAAALKLNGTQVSGEWGAAGEVSIGYHGWIGRRWTVGGSLFAGGEGLDFDQNGVRPGGFQAGLRLGMVFN